MALQRFDNIIGQKEAVRFLQNAVLTGHVPHAMILCGERGIGKMDLAMAFAAALQCMSREVIDDGPDLPEQSAMRPWRTASSAEIPGAPEVSPEGARDAGRDKEEAYAPGGSPSGTRDAEAGAERPNAPEVSPEMNMRLGRNTLRVEPCGHCRSCRQIEAGSHPDVIVVTNARVGAESKTNTIGVKAARFVQADVSIKPYEGPYKIYIVPDAHNMNPQAQNALLKTLEEPPAYAVILLLAQSTAAFLPTVLSRCITLRLHPAAEEELTSALTDVRTNNVASGQPSSVHGTECHSSVGRGSDPGQGGAGAGREFAARQGGAGVNRGSASGQGDADAGPAFTPGQVDEGTGGPTPGQGNAGTRGLTPGQGGAGAGREFAAREGGAGVNRGSVPGQADEGTGGHAPGQGEADAGPDGISPGSDRPSGYDRAVLCARLSHGNPGRCRQLASDEELWTFRGDFVEFMKRMPGVNSYEIAQYAESLTPKGASHVEDFLDFGLSWFRDILTAKSAGESEGTLIFADEITYISKVKDSLSYSALEAILRAFDDAARRRAAKGNDTQIVEVLLLNIRRAMSRR